jgi:uncharacterized protein YjdB
MKSKLLFITLWLLTVICPGVAAVQVMASDDMPSYHANRIDKLRRDILSAVDTLDKGGVKPFMDDGYVSRYKNLAGSFQQRLHSFDQYSSSKDYLATKQALDQMNMFLYLGETEKNKLVAKTGGDVQTVLRGMEENTPTLPRTLIREGYTFTQQDIENFTRQNHEAIRYYRDNLQKLQQIKQNAYLPLTPGTVRQGAKYDKQDVDRLIGSFSRNLRQAEANLNEWTAHMKHQTRQLEVDLDRFHYLPATADNFANEEAYNDRVQQLNSMLRTAQATDDPRLVQKVQQAMQAHQTQRGEVLKTVRMPAAKSDDKELLAVASSILKSPEYGADYIQRMVINADLQNYEKESSETRYDDVDVSLSGKVTLTGEKTTYHYTWQQFQVTTAERIGQRYFMFHNTFKYFTRGSTITPLRKWVLSMRIQGNEILKENIAKQ